MGLDDYSDEALSAELQRRKEQREEEREKMMVMVRCLQCAGSKYGRQCTMCHGAGTVLAERVE